MLLAPTVAYNDIAATLASGKADKAYFATLPLDVTPSTDDRPFFFNMVPLSKTFSSSSNRAPDQGVDFNDMATKILMLVSILTTAACAWIIGFPLFSAGLELRRGLGKAWPYLLYFACIGFGFMYIEISQMQHLIIFLGHPVYGLSVVLFTLLFFGGLGSYKVVTNPAPGYALNRSLMLLGVLAIIGVATPYVMHEFRHLETSARIFISVLLLAPAGFCMGWMFPLGIGLARRDFGHLLPWFWGTNGAASVLASVFAVLVSLSFGISFTYWLGVVLYGVCTLVISRLALEDHFETLVTNSRCT